MMIAFVGSTPGFQPDTVPSSVTQMNSACFPGASRKSAALPLKTMPVGVPALFWLGAPGTVTTSDGTVTGLVDALISVDVPVALFEIHHGVVAPWTSPQAFLKFGSATTVESAATFATRSVRL